MPILLLAMLLFLGSSEANQPMASLTSHLDESERMNFLLRCPSLVERSTSHEIASILIKNLGENRTQGWCTCALNAAIKNSDTLQELRPLKASPKQVEHTHFNFELAYMQGLVTCAGSIAISDTDVQALLKEASKLMEEKHQKLSEAHN